MARRMKAESFDIFRVLMVTEYLNAEGEVTGVTNEVFGPYTSKATASSAAWAAQPYDRYGRWQNAYYLKDDGQPDYKRPKKRQTAKRQQLKAVLVITAIAENQGVQSTELAWVDA